MKLLGRNKKNAEVSTKSKAPEKPAEGQKKKGFFLPHEKKEKKKGFFLPYESKDKYDSKRGFFRRSTRKMKAPPAKDIVQEKPQAAQTETRAAVEPMTSPKQEAPTPMAPVVEEEPPKQAEPSPKHSEVVPETVHSAEQEDEAEDQQPASPKAKVEDAPVAEERSPRNEEEDHDDDKEEEEGPAEPEGRSEEAEGEPAEKNTTNASCSREGSERTDSKMSVEDPAEETTGLLCGCI